MRRDIVTELLEEEWEKRRRKVIETRMIETEDIMILSIVRLNHEVMEIMSKMATKDDLKGMATKEDIKNMATKDDLKGMATKEDIKNMATKDDIARLRDELRMLKWSVGIGFTVIGILVTLVQVLIMFIK
ncbi:MAG: hypothetical protein QW534_02325 [Candidatus Methanomethylicia archaeon]